MKKHGFAILGALLIGLVVGCEGQREVTVPDQVPALGDQELEPVYPPGTTPPAANDKKP